ncbi:hypothetical protein [Poseidonocella sp. HB161398]|uniref:hypothetical protein n=1 Tax=Poseidonocella sp. HB161398 TaxID=2320855 RepID=UPI001109C74F|nr:hypothetical protein [Poseidonocella sp. HB161398]
MKEVVVPFGMAPALALGRIYNDGFLSLATQMGSLGQVFIAALQDTEYVTLSDVPADVFSDKMPRKSQQKLLLCRTPGLDVYIPPLELVRRLFLHERVLANVILRHGGLADLCVPVPAGHVQNLALEFTSAMPQKLLTEAFVREFAWLAAHPVGAASWNSVARLSNPEDGILLMPPELGGFTMTFRGLFGEGAALVYEILSLPGKSHGFHRLQYNHPAIKKKGARIADSASTNLQESEQEKASARVQKDFHIEGAPSRARGDPDFANWLRAGSDFINRQGSVRRQPLPMSSPRGSRSNATERQEAESVTSAETPQRESIKVSVSDISTIPQLPPLSFRTIQLASPDYIGDLEPLVDTLRRLQDLLPSTTTVSSSICAMPENSPLALAGNHRRPCLIATFTSVGKPPTVLLEIDHTGLTALSALGLHALTQVNSARVESYIVTALESLESNGHWPNNIEEIGKDEFKTQRIKRMLRHSSRSKSPEYQTKWAAMLIDKLKL